MATNTITYQNAQKQLKAVETVLKSCPQAQEDFVRLQNLVGRIFDKKTPTFAISLKQTDALAFLSFYKAMSSFHPPSVGNLDMLFKGLSGVLLQRGYRLNILTTQEHALSGSSKFDAYQFYIPLGLLQGKMTLDETRKARELQLFSGALAAYYPSLPVEDFYLTVRLETLGSDGRTLRDPRPISICPPPEIQSLGQLTLGGLEHQKSDNYPNRRD